MDDDGFEGSPVGFAGVEQGSDSVVVEVGEAESDAFDAFDQVVQRFGGAVADLGVVVVHDLLEPPFECSGEFAELGRHRWLGAMANQIVQHRPGGLNVRGAVELPESFFYPVGQGDFTGWVAEFQQCGESLLGGVVEFLLTCEQHAADPVERVIAAATVPGLLLLDPTPDLVSGPVGELDTVERIDDLPGPGQHHRVHRSVGG